MATRKQRDVESALRRKGFIEKQGDHSFFTYHRAADGKKTSVFTQTSHGESELGDVLLEKMAKQCALSKDDFLRLVDCPLERNEYEALLRECKKIE